MEELFTEIQRLEDHIIDVKEFKTDEKSFAILFNTLVDKCAIKSLKKPEDTPYSEEDYLGIADNGQKFLSYIHRIFCKLCEIQKRKVIYKDDTICKVILDSLYVSLQYQNSSSFWSNKNCAAISTKIIYILVLLSRSESESVFLFGKEYSESKIDCNGDDRVKVLFPNGIFKLLLNKNSENFHKSSWKKNPHLIDSYFWMLKKIRGAKVTYDYIQYFLPPALFLLDDWELKHKLYGANALEYILNETGYADLRLFGRAEVIYDALKHQLYSKEEEVLALVFPCAIKAAVIIEKDPSSIGSIKKRKLDLIMDHLLREMAYEERIALRGVYISNLHTLVSAMEVYSSRWTKEILNVCSYYLETFEGPSACDRIKTLQVIKLLIKYGWPRIHDCLTSIMKMIAKVVYLTSKGDSSLDEKAALTIQIESREIVNLLFAAAPLTFKDLCSSITSLSKESLQFKAVLFIFEDVLDKL